MVETKKKDIRLNIRISKELRDEFQSICDAKSVNGSDLVRKFIEKWVSENRK